MEHEKKPQIWIIRHAETAWSLSGQHTGLTDIPLTAKGEKTAGDLKPWISKMNFKKVFSSPLGRAQHTAELCGLKNQTEVEPLLLEWNYGDYEGLTTAEIQQQHPDWDIWRDGCPNGETMEQVHARARKLLAKISSIDGHVALFSHGHFSRYIIATWLDLPAMCSGHFAIRAGSISVLGWEHANKVLWSMGSVPDGPGVGR